MNTRTTSSSGQVPVAVVGMGYWGKNLVRNFHEIGCLHTVCDADPAVGDTVRAQYAGACFVPDYPSVLSDPDIGAVVLATPAAQHFAMAKQALEAGKDVYVEKPLSLKVEDGEALVRLATQRQRILMVGHILRYHPAVIKLLQLVQNGDLGNILYFYSNRLNLGKIRTEENILWSFAPHDISVMLALLNEEPSAVSCQGGGYLYHSIPDVTLSEFLFPSGVRAHIYVSWLHPFKEQRMVIVGSERMAVFDDTREDKLVLYAHKVEWKNRRPVAVKSDAQKVAIDATEPLRAECLHFLDCARERRTPLTDGHEGLRVLKVLSACQADLEKAPAGAPRPRGPAPSARPDVFVHESAYVDDGAQIGKGTKVWHFSHVSKGARIGEGAVLGQNVFVAEEAVIGSNVKIQNNVSVFSGVTVEDDVFLGPSCVLTNVSNPRSQIQRHALYEKTLLRRGATVGANATILCGATVGRYAFVGAGAVVTAAVPDYALVMGNPAHRQGWMSRHGHRLGAPDAQGILVCPESGYRYREVEPGVLRCLDLSEDAPLPDDQRVGKRSYPSFKRDH